MARNFNSSTDLISISDTSSVSPSGSQTEACWIYFNSVASRGDFFGKWVSAGNEESWLLTNISNGTNITLHYFLSQTGASGNGVDSLVVTATGQWYHVAGTWDGTTQSIYVNGALKATGTPGFASIHTSFTAITLGNSDSSPFSGNIGDAAVWSVALSAGEVAALAQGARPGNIRPSSLVIWVSLDGLQSPEPDFSGAKNNGTLTGTALAAGPPTMMFTPRWPQFRVAATGTPGTWIPMGFAVMPNMVRRNTIIAGM